MKKFLLSLSVFLFILPSAYAGEGMWIPSQLEQKVLRYMQENGCRLQSAEIYNAEQPSLNDAVVWFGRGCTGEIISDRGLLLTNHHCGYGQIQSHSTIENDYLKNGYWAYDDSTELPCKGLTVTFMISIEDVTETVLKEINDNVDEDKRADIISSRSDSLVKVRTEGTHYEGFVKSYYFGNHFFLFRTEKFKDVRLVGAPPSSIGKFGGDTDNWIWPRHTGDIALFRVYAGPDNKPADYSLKNVPLKPRHHFPVSLKGADHGEFTMVYGFPGRTNQYITSEAVTLIERKSNPAKIKIRGIKLSVIDKAISSNDTIRLMYASKQARIANAYKKWQGEILGTERVKTIERKKKKEHEFELWASGNGHDDFTGITAELNKMYEEITPYQLAYDNTREALWGTEALTLVKKYFKLEEKILAEKKNSKSLNGEKGRFLVQTKSHFSKIYHDVDKSLFIKLITYVKKNMDPSFRPDFLNNLPDSDQEISEWAEKKYDESVFTDPGELEHTIRTLDYKSARILKGDPLYRIAVSINDFETNSVLPARNEIRDKIGKLMRTYMKALLMKDGEDQLYPDANSSLRISFGNVEGLHPRDGISYRHYTTLEGVIEKEIPGDDEFTVPEKLKSLFEARDYGQYGRNDTLFVGFIASNHTTGGNSGSPVLNADGHLIGTNFDRIWEGTMSDIEFDPERCRNISVDIRYTLFLIDKFAGCSRLIEEMTIVK